MYLPNWPYGLLLKLPSLAFSSISSLKPYIIHWYLIHTQGRPSFIKLHFLSFILVHGSHLESHITYYGQPNIALMLLRCFHVSLTILGLTLFNSLPLSTYSHFLIDEYGWSYSFQLGILDLSVLLNQTINSLPKISPIISIKSPTLKTRVMGFSKIILWYRFKDNMILKKWNYV